MNEILAGCLYVVGTPLGNLQDLSPRALDVLRRVTVLAAEDTRVARHLLGCFDIDPPQHLISYREQNRAEAAARIVELLQAGATAALVTDAGMPCVSDPGDVLVAACHEAGLTVCPVPGPSAVLAALAASGIAGPRFCFEGFLSRRGSHRRAHLAGLAHEPRTMIFFEAPSRVADTLSELAEAFGPGRMACVARELTKRFEEVRRAPLSELLTWSASKEMRGEMVIVVAGLDPDAPPPPGALGATAASQVAPAALLAELIAQGMSRKDAAREASQRLGLARRDLYRMAMEL